MGLFGSKYFLTNFRRKSSKGNLSSVLEGRKPTICKTQEIKHSLQPREEIYARSRSHLYSPYHISVSSPPAMAWRCVWPAAMYSTFARSTPHYSSRFQQLEPQSNWWIWETGQRVTAFSCRPWKILLDLRIRIEVFIWCKRERERRTARTKVEENHVQVLGGTVRRRKLFPWLLNYCRAHSSFYPVGPKSARISRRCYKLNNMLNTNKHLNHTRTQQRCKLLIYRGRHVMV